VAKEAIAKQPSKPSRVKVRIMVHLPCVSDGAILQCSMQSAPAGSAELVIGQRWRLPDSSRRHSGSFRPRSFTNSVHFLTSPRKNSWNDGSCGHAV
jgi:hypothetical protein